MGARPRCSELSLKLSPGDLLDIQPSWTLFCVAFGDARVKLGNSFTSAGLLLADFHEIWGITASRTLVGTGASTCNIGHVAGYRGSTREEKHEVGERTRRMSKQMQALV